MIVFWARFVPPLRPFDFHIQPPHPLIVLAALLLCAVPAILPAAYFRPRKFERGVFYRRLGVRQFRYLAPDGDWVNQRLRRLDPFYRVVRDRRTRREQIAGSVTNERWHLSFFLAGLGTQVFAMVTRQYLWAAAISILNIVFNLYPVLHQRYKRARLRRVSGSR